MASIRARMSVSITLDSDATGLVSSWSLDGSMLPRSPDPVLLLADHRNVSNLVLGSYYFAENRTVVLSSSPPLLARSSCPVVGPLSPIVVTTDKWTNVAIDLRFLNPGVPLVNAEFRVISLAQGSLFPMYQNGTYGAEISSSNTLIPWSAVYYKPNTLLFSSAGDVFTYEVAFPIPMNQRFVGTVVIDENLASDATGFATTISSNGVQRWTLPCADGNGEFSTVEILSLPAVGSLYQLSPSILFKPGPLRLSEPITASGTIVRHASGSVGYIAPDNILSSASTSFLYRCHDRGAPQASAAGAVGLLVSPAPHAPLAGYGQYALQFDGIRSTAYSELSNNSSTTIRTIELWVKFVSSPSMISRAAPPETAPSRQVLVQGMYDSIGQYYWTFFAQSTNASSVRLGFGNHNFSSGFEYIEALSDPLLSIQLDTWHHVAVSVKEPLATFYVDGVRFGSPVTVGSMSVVRRVQLGSIAVVAQALTAQHFMGVMDEVRLWPEVLDSPELALSMQNSPLSIALFAAAFVWDFNEGTGGGCKDSVKQQNLLLGLTTREWDRPRWVVSDGPQFTTVVGRENDPILVYLTAGSLAKASAPFGYAIVELPHLGKLYQVNTTDASDPGEPINSVFFDWLSPPSLQQWVASVVSYSSYRRASGDWTLYHPDNVIGAPFNSSLFVTDDVAAPAALFNFESLSFNTSANISQSSWSIWPVSSEKVSSLAPNNSAAHMWTPAGCNVSSAMEFIEVQYSSEVFPQKVEIYSSMRPDSIRGVWAWDMKANSWVPLYGAQESGGPLSASTEFSDDSAFNVFAPPFCQPTLSTSRVRVEVDPCRSSSWAGIAAIHLVGTELPRAGLVTDSASRILYVPPLYESGTEVDSFAFAAIACPYDLQTASSPLRLSVDITARNNAPLSTDLRLTALENSEVYIQLKGFDPDGDPIKFILSSIPSVGILYQLSNASEKLEPVTINGTVVTHPRGLLLWTPPKVGPSCGILFSNFSYFVTDVGSSSNASYVIVDVNCTPGAYSLSLGLLYTSWGIAAALLVLAAALLVLAILYKGHKSVRKSQPALLIIMLVGAIACYASVFMFSTRITDAICHVRIWLLNVGITLTLGFAALWLLSFSTQLIGLASFRTLVVKMFHVWRMFSAKMFRRNSELTPTHTAIFLAVLVAIEMAQLLVYSIVAAPFMQEEVDPANNAIRHQSCQSAIAFSPMYLFIYKGVLVVLTTCIYVLIRSVTKTRFKPESLEMLLFSVYGMFVSGAVAVPILLLVKDRDALFLLGCISIAAPVTICLILIFIPKMRSVLRKKREQDNDTIEQFTLRAMTSSPTNAATGGTPQKQGRKTAKRTGKKRRNRTDKPIDPTQNLMELSKFSEDKSVLELLEAIQDKDSEIAVLKSKMVKNQYKMQTLKQKLMVSEGSRRGFREDDDYDL